MQSYAGRHFSIGLIPVDFKPENSIFYETLWDHGVFTDQHNLILYDTSLMGNWSERTQHSSSVKKRLDI